MTEKEEILKGILDYYYNYEDDEHWESDEKCEYIYEFYEIKDYHKIDDFLVKKYVKGKNMTRKQDFKCFVICEGCEYNYEKIIKYDIDKISKKDFEKLFKNAKSSYRDILDNIIEEYCEDSYNHKGQMGDYINYINKTYDIFIDNHIEYISGNN